MKKKIVMIGIILLVVGCLVSIYATFAFNEDEKTLDDSLANYNLIYNMKEKSNKEVEIASGEEKYLDINLNNTYSSTVKYGIYYYLTNLKKLPDGVFITLAENSQDALSNIINPNQTRSISIKIVNNSEYSVKLIIGALVGFESGDINELVQDGEVLIK